MTNISILLRTEGLEPRFGDFYKNIGKVQVNNENEEKELIGFLTAGLEAYEDWKVNGD